MQDKDKESLWIDQLNELLTEVFPNVVRYAGVGIVLWQAVITGINVKAPERPSILLAAVTMIGLKTALKFFNGK